MRLAAAGPNFEDGSVEMKLIHAMRHTQAVGGRRTLIELIVATAIMVILVGAVFPIARNAVAREREHELRQDLWMMRDAIDRYKDAADRGAFQIKVDSGGYPPDLDTLVTGVDVGGKKLKFLRRIPVDPMTKSTEWGMRSMQDEKDSIFLGRAERFRCL
jgi:general secretion pathway protein G